MEELLVYVAYIQLSHCRYSNVIEHRLGHDISVGTHFLQIAQELTKSFKGVIFQSTHGVPIDYAINVTIKVLAKGIPISGDLETV